MYSQNDVMRFMALFSGAKEFYGVTLVGDIVNGKAQSTSSCVHSPLMPTIISQHFEGSQSIGVSPLKADDTIEFGAIDIDNYTGDLQAIIHAIWRYDLPICPCYSKSKKLHLYFFFEMGTKADEAVAIMKWYANIFGCDNKVEIFPKQVHRSISNKAYSWINLPYTDVNNESNHRKMVKQDGTLASLDEFLDRAEDIKLSLEFHKNQRERIPLYDAPPCILTSLLLNDVGEGGRNNFLFSVAVYLKLKDEDCDLDTLLTEINDSLPSPLSYEELHNTVLSSMEKHNYFYMCSAMQHCNKALCHKLEHGVGSIQSTGLSYGDLTQYMQDPPYYDWEINGQKMTFYSETELLSQTKFRALCLRKLHLVPRKVDDSHWSKLLTKCSLNMKVKYPDKPGGDFSAGSIFYDLVSAYFTDKRKALNMTQINLGRVYEDTEAREYVFSSNSFLGFVVDTNNFKGFTQMEMKTKLEEMGAYKSGIHWRIPFNAIQKDSVEPEIDFDVHEGESNDF